MDWYLGHLGRSEIWGRACSCSSGSNEQDDVPFLLKERMDGYQV